MYIAGLNPLKLCEGILNVLLAKSLITKQEADAIVEAAKAPKT